VAKAERGAITGTNGSGDDSGGTISVPHHAGGARKARQRLGAELERLVPPALVADAVAVAAELLGNAVRHAAPLPGNTVHVDWRVDTDEGGTVVELRVTDGGSLKVPHERTHAPESVGGRGLAIVAALARSWGVERDGAGQCVWARLRSGD
jgi:two-component sensor histidine kinase